ncbi:MAG: heavy-metal-associated domain-containing protein [Verrucomicrobiae bacterium]|nr:heavy-metal-associated domain-containing protein [Verrucomicrobiae bacterium]
MKAITLLSLVLTAAFSLLSLRAEEAGAWQVKVPEMKCAGCAWSIGEELKKVDHITEVFVDPKTKVAIFSVDSAEGADENAVLAAVKAAGYEGKSYSRLKTSFAEAKAALSKS